MECDRRKWFLRPGILWFGIVLLICVPKCQAQEKIWRIGSTFSAYALPDLEEGGYQVGLQALRQWKSHWFWEGSVSISKVGRSDQNPFEMPFKENMTFVPIRVGLVRSTPHFRHRERWVTFKVGLGLVNAHSNIVFDGYSLEDLGGFEPSYYGWFWGPYIGLGIDLRMGESFTLPLDFVYQSAFQINGTRRDDIRFKSKRLDTVMVTMGVMKFM